MKLRFSLAILCLGIATLTSAQQRVAPVDAQVSAPDVPRPLPTNAPQPPSGSADYVLGGGDQISVIVTDLPDDFANRTFRVDMSGDVNLPLAGRVHAAGLTTRELEQEIAKNMTKILKQPEVVVGVTAFASEPVSILGEVNNPGVHQVSGDGTLLRALSAAGGFTKQVGNTITITREQKWGNIPLPNSHSDSTGQFSVAMLNVKDILHATNPASNIPVMPDDVISVSRAEVVYAVGSVNKPGGFELGQNQGLSTLQVVSLAEGLNKTAAPQRAMILRQVGDSKQRTEIAVNLKRLMQGDGADVPLEPGDILFVPNSKAKSVTYRTLEAAITMTTGMAVYGRY